jgi:hypothetical protein
MEALRVFLLIVIGLGGDPEHTELFHAWGDRLVQASERLGVAPERIIHLVDQPGESSTPVTGRSTREEVRAAFGRIAKESRPDDLVFVVLIGHGSFDGRVARFNLPGPDLTATDYNELLGTLPAKQIVFVNTASSSGAFLPELSGPGRTIVTATRSGAQHFAPLFGGYFVDALTSEEADADKNARVSVLEAFQFARREVARAYESRGFLATEHALLDDAGDGQGTQEPSATGAQGRVAAVLSLGTVTGDLPDDPALRELHLERRALERQIEALRLLKDTMPPARYTAELEQLATAIALKTREIRAAEDAAGGAQGR